VLVALSGETADGLRSCDQVVGDSFVLRPYKRDAVAASLRAMATVRFERRRATKLEADLAAERARLLRFGEVDPLTGFPHFEFFKKLLVIELKRARRYGYSLAACLVAQDEAPGPAVSAAAQKQVHAQIARLVRTVIRDIDQPVDYADGHFLVFLPYTDLAGAERVGRRLETAVRAAPPVDDGGRRVSMTVSVGIAALKKGREVSFARLIRDASTALRAAQLKGGGRVVVR
jgi:diguanylate cyclase (GGDEF)-like protein